MKKDEKKPKEKERNCFYTEFEDKEISTPDFFLRA